MANPFIGQIKVVGFNFAPRGWALCYGQLLAISQNDALFSLLGTIYGGDGRTTFGLPDMRGRVATHQGTGPGLSEYRLGNRGGVERVTLTPAQLVPHRHDLGVATAVGTLATPSTNVVGAAPAGLGYAFGAGTETVMPAGSLTDTGGGGSHDNIQPCLVLNYVIALQGTYPSRS